MLGKKGHNAELAKSLPFAAGGVFGSPAWITPDNPLYETYANAGIIDTVTAVNQAMTSDVGADGQAAAGSTADVMRAILSPDNVNNAVTALQTNDGSLSSVTASALKQTAEDITDIPMDTLLSSENVTSAVNFMTDSTTYNNPDVINAVNQVLSGQVGGFDFVGAASATAAASPDALGGVSPLLVAAVPCGVLAFIGVKCALHRRHERAEFRKKYNEIFAKSRKR